MFYECRPPTAVYQWLSVVIHQQSHHADKHILAVHEKTAVLVPGVSENRRHSNCSPGLATPSPDSVHGFVLCGDQLPLARSHPGPALLIRD